MKQRINEIKQLTEEYLEALFDIETSIDLKKTTPDLVFKFNHTNSLLYEFNDLFIKELIKKFCIPPKL